MAPIGLPVVAGIQPEIRADDVPDCARRSGCGPPTAGSTALVTFGDSWHDNHVIVAASGGATAVMGAAIAVLTVAHIVDHPTTYRPRGRSISARIV